MYAEETKKITLEIPLTSWNVLKTAARHSTVPITDFIKLAAFKQALKIICLFEECQEIIKAHEKTT